MNHNFFLKIISLVAILFVGMLFIELIMMGLAYLNDLKIESDEDLMNLLQLDQYTGLVKFFVSTSHFILFTLCPLVFLYIFYKGNVVKHLKLSHFNPVLILLFPLALFSLNPLMRYLSDCTEMIDFPDFLIAMDKDSMESMSKLLAMNSFTDLAINLFMVGILPGIGEELLFRGIIQNELSQKIKNPHIAIWLTAILFSAFHFQVTGFLPKMMIGLVLGYAYHISGSLILSMFIHALNNSFATVALFFAGGNLDTSSLPKENIPLTSVLISTLVFGWLMFFIYSIAQKDMVENE